MRTRLPGWFPTAAVLVIAAAGLARILMEHWRQGGVLIAGALLVAAALRSALPPERVGLLAIRSRVVDVVCYVVPAIALVLLAVTITRGQLTLP